MFSKISVASRLSAKLAPTLLLAASVLVTSAAATAKAECNSATIRYVMRSNGKCGGNAIFQTDKTTGNVWVCTSNEAQSSLLLAAFLAGRPIDYKLAGNSGCQTTTYDTSHAVDYLIVRP